MFVNKNEILKFTGKWVVLEKIILREATQAKKDKHKMFALICDFSLQIFRYVYTTQSNRRNQESIQGPSVRREAWKGNSWIKVI